MVWCISGSYSKLVAVSQLRGSTPRLKNVLIVNRRSSVARLFLWPCISGRLELVLNRFNSADFSPVHTISFQSGSRNEVPSVLIRAVVPRMSGRQVPPRLSERDEYKLPGRSRYDRYFRGFATHVNVDVENSRSALGDSKCWLMRCP